MYCITPVRIKVSKYKFGEWRTGKLDKSELEGEKVLLHKLRAKTAYKQKKVVTITKKEKEIMDFVYRQVQSNNYITEKDIVINEYSKALVQKTIKNKDILDVYGLKRIRVSKNIKKKLGITNKGYPYIICKGG